MSHKVDSPASPNFEAGSVVPSPCVNVCRMNAQAQLCEGCQRTIGEIAAWATLDEAAKRSIWESLRRRRANLREDPAPCGGAAAVSQSLDRSS